MRTLTMVLPHFQNLGMLAEQQKVWASYPKDLRQQLHVVVVDDCSPKGHRPSAKSVTIDGLASLRLYRLTVKKRWNWLACRNLGAKVATTPWLLLTDMDHVVPVETLEQLVHGPLDPANAYRFKRVTATTPWPYPLSACTDYKSHNDTWLMTRDLFFDRRVGGYDERLSGCYGTSGEFRDRVMAAAKAHVVLNEVIIRYPREVIPDASTSPSVYTRKNDPKNDELLADLKIRRARIPNWRPLHGLVPHEEVYSSLNVEASV
jgi:hypothetical protein